MDTSILKADIFFAVTTVAVIVLSIGLSFVMYYLVNILKDIKYLSGKAKIEGEKIIDDVRAFREEAEDKGYKITNLLYSFLGLVRSKPKTKSKKSEDVVE